MLITKWASQVALVAKNSAANAGDLRNTGFVPGPGRPPGGRHGNPLQYSRLENPMDRGAWWATVGRVIKSQTTEAASLAGLGGPIVLVCLGLRGFLDIGPSVPKRVKP